MKKKYEDWTTEETEKLLDAVGGIHKARMVIHYRTRKLVVTTPTPVVGTIVKTLRLKPYQASVADAIQLGQYNYYDSDITKIFPVNQVELVEAVDVHLVEFNTDLFNDEILDWAKANRKKPMQAQHTLAIGFQYPQEQVEKSIIGLGSIEEDCALSLSNMDEFGQEDRRLNSRRGDNRGWVCYVRFGFVDV